MAVALTDDERDRLAAICASLPPADAALLARAVPALRPSQRESRDTALRILAARFYREVPAARGRAQAIETDLVRLRSIASHGSADTGDTKRAAILNVLQLNGGQPLAWRQIFSIIA